MLQCNHKRNKSNIFISSEVYGMNNWNGDENDAMRGYLIYAGKLAAERDSEFTEEHLKAILKMLYRATDEMTAEQARNYYLNSEY